MCNYNKVSFCDGSFFTKFNFYDPCRVGPNTPYLWCMNVATQASFLYLVRLYIFPGVDVFLLFLY